MREPTFQVIYEGKDISRDLKPFLAEVVFTDKLHGEADTLDLLLDNQSLLWLGDWRPRRTDTIACQLGYANQVLLDCGTFQVDRMDWDGPPDRIKVGALSTGISKALRQPNTVAYEKTTLAEIAQQVASRNGLTVAGTVPEVRLERVSQNQQTDLGFVLKLADEYGAIVKVERDKLVFYDRLGLRSLPPALRLGRGDLKQYSFSDASQDSAKAAQVSYTDPKTKQTITHTETDPSNPKGDTLKVKTRVENPEQARLKARAALDKANRPSLSGRLNLEGNTAFMAGLTVRLQGFYSLDGTWQIEQATHRISRSSGYTTEINLEGV